MSSGSIPVVHDALEIPGRLGPASLPLPLDSGGSSNGSYGQVRFPANRRRRSASGAYADMTVAGVPYARSIVDAGSPAQDAKGHPRPASARPDRILGRS